MLCALAAAEMVARLARAWRIGDAAERNWSRSRLWAAATVALVVVFFGQELLEGAIFAGHPAGLAGERGGAGYRHSVPKGGVAWPGRAPPRP